MSIADQIVAKGIGSVVHFTTNRGALGVLASRSLKARKRLNEDEQLKHIFQANAASRKDAAWLDYVNLSVSRINEQFFAASGNWHREKNFWWCILSFDPQIMTHEGVFFTTTNNMYTGVVQQAGEAGFDQMFAQRVVRWSGNVVQRTLGTADCLTTCKQAEVLYPGEVSTDYLRRIYVKSESDGDELAAQMSVVNHREVEIVVQPDLFGGIQ
jgi:hypothetical protein